MGGVSRKSAFRLNLARMRDVYLLRVINSQESRSVFRARAKGGKGGMGPRLWSGPRGCGTRRVEVSGSGLTHAQPRRAGGPATHSLGAFLVGIRRFLLRQ